MYRAREVFANDTLTLSTLLLGLVVAFYLLNHDQRSPSGSFFVAERVGSHTCALLNAQGAQVCKANLMSLIKATVWKEAKIKNKVCAGLEAHANDTLSPPNRG